MAKLKIGLIREGKVPPDSRVPLIPEQCRYVLEKFPVDIHASPSVGRCYKDEEYQDSGIDMSLPMEECDVLMGVKEVPIELLIPNKAYFFFSHTIKKQPYNRKLLQACIEKNIRLIDYEVLTDENRKRLIAFGVFAGMVGAHNGLMTYGRRTGDFDLPRMNSFFDYASVVANYKTMDFPPIKIILTGTGRVGSGAAKVLDDMGIRKVKPREFLENNYNEPVYAQLECGDYVKPKSGGQYDKKEFYGNPESYESIFEPYTQVADIMINGIYWDSRSPAFFSKEQMASKDFNIKVIADVTCDIAPESSIPSTIFASTIADPIFGYDPHTGTEVEPHKEGVIDMMTIDNLPNELPRDASKAFGEQFINHILPELLKENSSVIRRGTVCENGDLTTEFEYLRDYVEGTESLKS